MASYLAEDCRAMVTSAASSATPNSVSKSSLIALFNAECIKPAELRRRLIIEFTPAYVVVVFGGPARRLVDQPPTFSEIYPWARAAHRVDQQQSEKRGHRKGNGIDVSSSMCLRCHLGPPNHSLREAPP